jgi:hypothetical protein
MGFINQNPFSFQLRPRARYFDVAWISSEEKFRLLPRTGERRDYFIRRGLRLSIEKIARFATILEDVFVDDDYVSRVIGDLSNFNVRRTLELAQRVITSATLRVEDIFKRA